MKIQTILFCLLSSLLLQPSAFPQGLLVPPGPPAPTMKALDEIEPRINIQRTVNPLPGDATFRYIINTRGSYYLSANLDATNSGIHVTVEGVTIDLNGFQISGAGAAGSGIMVDVPANDCIIKNGSITGFLGDGISASSRGGAVSHVSASNCRSGISVGQSWQVDHCTARDNDAVGITTGGGSTISFCTASSNLSGMVIGSDSLITDCSASGNQGTAGIATEENCTLNHCLATRNTSNSSQSSGIRTGGRCTITACSAQSNTNSFGTGSGSTGSGISVGDYSKVQNCSATSNKGDGIRATSNCSIVGNASSNSGVFNPSAAEGVHVTGEGNRIEENHVSNNSGAGIRVDSGRNAIIKNSVSMGSGSGGYNIAPSNITGTIVSTEADMNAASNSNVNILNP